jgi:hypothetical protein
MTARSSLHARAAAMQLPFGRRIATEVTKARWIETCTAGAATSFHYFVDVLPLRRHHASWAYTSPSCHSCTFPQPAAALRAYAAAPSCGLVRCVLSPSVQSKLSVTVTASF